MCASATCLRWPTKSAENRLFCRSKLHISNFAFTFLSQSNSPREKSIRHHLKVPLHGCPCASSVSPDPGVVLEFLLFEGAWLHLKPNASMSGVWCRVGGVWRADAACLVHAAAEKVSTAVHHAAFWSAAGVRQQRSVCTGAWNPQPRPSL